MMNRQSQNGGEGRGAEGWLKAHEGWARLLISTFVWIATVGYIAGQASEQQKASISAITNASTTFADTATKLNLRLDNLSDQITRLAISNERLSVQMTDQVKSADELRRRLEKVEERR